MSHFRRLTVINFARAGHLNQVSLFSKLVRRDHQVDNLQLNLQSPTSHPRLRNPTDHHVVGSKKDVCSRGSQAIPELLHSQLPVEDIDQVRPILGPKKVRVQVGTSP